MGSMPRLMPGQGAIIAAGAIDYPAEYHGVAPETRAIARHQQGDDAHLHLRPSHYPGRRIRHVPGQGAELLEGEESFYEEIFAHLKMPHQPVRWEPDRQSGAARPDAAARGSRQGSGRHPAHQCLPGARPSDRRSRSVGCRAELPSRARSVHLWADHLGPRPRFLTGSLGEAIGEGAPQPVATLREILETAAPDLLRQDRRAST